MNFDYSQVPPLYVHCFCHDCPQAADCLRHLAGLHCPDSVQQTVAVNPRYARSHAGQCPRFQSNRLVRVAWGIRELLDNVPHKQAVALRKSLINHFGKNNFYRLQRKERGLSPADQQAVRRLFRFYGLTQEPAYEYYTESYDWGQPPRSGAKV